MNGAYLVRRWRVEGLILVMRFQYVSACSMQATANCCSICARTGARSAPSCVRAYSVRVRAHRLVIGCRGGVKAGWNTGGSASTEVGENVTLEIHTCCQRVSAVLLAVVAGRRGRRGGSLRTSRVERARRCLLPHHRRQDREGDDALPLDSAQLGINTANSRGQLSQPSRLAPAPLLRPRLAPTRSPSSAPLSPDTSSSTGTSATACRLHHGREPPLCQEERRASSRGCVVESVLFHLRRRTRGRRDLKKAS